MPCYLFLLLALFLFETPFFFYKKKELKDLINTFLKISKKNNDDLKHS